MKLLLCLYCTLLPGLGIAMILILKLRMHNLRPQYGLQTIIMTQNQGSLTLAHHQNTPRLCQIADLIAVEPFNVLLLNQALDRFLDVLHFGLEAVTDQRDGFGDKKIVLHLLAGLHDAYDSGL